MSDVPAPGPGPGPSGRKAAGIAMIVALIVAWAVLVPSLAPLVGAWPVLVQGAFYLVMGLAWIVPLRPVLRWAETGCWRAPLFPGSPPADRPED